MSVCIYRSQGWPVEHFFFRSLQPVYCIKCGTLKIVVDHSIYIYLRMDLFFFYVLLPWLWFINDVNRKKEINYKREKDKWERKLTHKMEKKMKKREETFFLLCSIYSRTDADVAHRLNHFPSLLL
jgi:hypothetical protein